MIGRECVNYMFTLQFSIMYHSFRKSHYFYAKKINNKTNGTGSFNIKQKVK